MRYDYDLDADALYVWLSDEAATRQITIRDGMIIDVDAEGRAVGLEVLSPASSFDLRALFEAVEVAESDRMALAMLACSPLYKPAQPRESDAPASIFGDEERETTTTQSTRGLLAGV